MKDRFRRCRRLTMQDTAAVVLGLVLQIVKPYPNPAESPFDVLRRSWNLMPSGFADYG